MVRSWRLRVRRAELRARQAERDRDFIGDLAARAMNMLSDDDLSRLREALTREEGADS